MAAAPTIVIAGAGIGGLTAALALAAQGYRVVILEKAERLEEAGAGLQLSPNATRILVGLGLRERLAARAVTPDAISIMSTRSGGEIARLPLGAEASRADAPYWVLHRADLQSVLQAAVEEHPAIELRLGCAFENVTGHADGVTVSQRSGNAHQEHQALALIGADGIWSTVRQRLFPQMQPEFSGLIAWRGTIEASQLPPDPSPKRVQLWMGARAHLVTYPISGARRINIVAIVPGNRTSSGWSDHGDASEIGEAFGARHWPETARMMIAGVGAWRKWGLFTLRDRGEWCSGGAALLGDAAHATLPFAAQGAAMAIEDAAVLAKCLAAGGNPAAVAAALKRYSALRRPRVARMQRAAWQNGKIYHLRGAAAVARDVFIQAIGAERLMARQRWIYDWRA